MIRPVNKGTKFRKTFRNWHSMQRPARIYSMEQPERLLLSDTWSDAWQNCFLAITFTRPTAGSDVMSGNTTCAQTHRPDCFLPCPIILDSTYRCRQACAFAPQQNNNWTVLLTSREREKERKGSNRERGGS